MRQFLVNIWAYDYHAKFTVLAEDSASSIEQAIIDKLGEKSIKWESTGMYRDTRRITYEEVIMTQDLYTTKRSLELEWQQEHLKEGKYNINMSYIDKKIQEIVKEIIAKEFEEQTLQTKIDESKPEVSIAT